LFLVTSSFLLRLLKRTATEGSEICDKSGGSATKERTEEEAETNPTPNPTPPSEGVLVNAEGEEVPLLAGVLFLLISISYGRERW